MADLGNILPWLCLLIVFGAMAMLQYRSQTLQSHAQSESNDLAKLLAQMLAGTVPAPITITAPKVIPQVVNSPLTPLPPPAPAQVPSAKPSGPLADYPKWAQWALHEIGFHEVGNNQGLDRYIALAHCGENGQPWCAIFANAALEASGIPGSRSPSSQSFRTHPDFVQLSGPAPGAIVVFWRISKSSGQGHVGFYRGEDATRVWTLGGNENDMVQIEALPKDSASFGLIGYWWPKSVPLPKVGAVLMPAGSPVSIQKPPADSAAAGPAAPKDKQTRIIATVFGGQASAYGGQINDDAPGVALPFRFSGDRPRVRVTNTSTGASVVCEIVDVGPWNTRDPYWETGARPQAETGTDLTGRRTNGAGIDLTAAAAKAAQIDGKGLVDWQFVTSSPEPSTEPKVV